MKCLPLIVMLISSMLVAACSSLPSDRNVASAGANQDADTPTLTRASETANRVTIRDAAGSAVLQKVEFRPGVSSATVERLAKRFACTGGAGAGLITDKGPVEVYRMRCDNGSTFLAQCELRQCRPMRQQ